MNKRAPIDNAARRAVVSVCIWMVVLLVAALNLAEVFPFVAGACGFAFLLLAGWLAGYSIKPV